MTGGQDAHVNQTSNHRLAGNPCIDMEIAGHGISALAKGID
jgi:hypothetical protein